MIQTNRIRLAFLGVMLAIGATTFTSQARPALGSPQAVEHNFSSPTLSSAASAQSAFEFAVSLEQCCDAACVDHYYLAATLAWQELEPELPQPNQSQCQPANLYQSALSNLIRAGQQFHRFDPRRGLDVMTEVGLQTVPIAYRGFYWKPDDFDKLDLIKNHESEKLNNWYRYNGVGVSTVAIHDHQSDDVFLRDTQPFSTTVVLRPNEGGQFHLEFLDPLRITSINVNGKNVKIQRDLTAAIEHRMDEAEEDDPFTAFIYPGGSTENVGLFFIEPYQPGKIPLLFVHGLLSSPLTWANIANELRARPDLVERYQVGGFEYATGEPFLKSAALLREQLQLLQMQVDPNGTDAALAQMVVVGHSMGGLVSKLQVTHSQTQLWDAVSCRPMDQIQANEETRRQLAEAFYFEPSPVISRVVYMGTPHKGSPWAKRPIGRIGARLVEEPSSMKELHRQLIDQNPGIFSREFEKRIPTSIDMLRADSPLLLRMNCLQYSDRVQLHSVIGYGYCSIGSCNSDKFVPVSSAKTHSVITEKMVHTKHTDINSNEEVLQELLCIFRQHILEFDQSFQSK